MILTKTLRNWWPSSSRDEHPIRPAVDFVQSRKGITREVILAMESGSMLAVSSPVLGKGLFLAGVKDFRPDGEEGVVTLHDCDATGTVLSRPVLSLSEIRLVIPFPRAFEVVVRR